MNLNPEPTSSEEVAIELNARARVTPWGEGLSKSAIRRRAERNRQRVVSGTPGDVVEMSRDRKYLVAGDGSFRRLAA